MAQFEEKEFDRINFSTWKLILKTIWKDKKNVIFLLLSVICTSVLDVTYPLLNQYAIDTYFNVDNVALDKFSNVPGFIILYILVSLCYFAVIGGFISFAGKVEANTSYELRKLAYDKLQELSFSYYDVTPQGWLMARMTSDSRRLASIISWGVVDLLMSLCSMIGILIVIIIKNIQLALIIIIILPFMIGISMFLNRLILKSQRSARKVNSQITASYNEGFMGSKTSKSLVIEEENNKEFSSLTNRFKKHALRATIFSSLFGPAIFIIGYIGVGTTLYQGGIMVLNGVITVGTLYLFIDYTIRFFDPVMQIAGILAEFQQAQASAERIVSLIETKAEIVDTPEVIEKYGDMLHPKIENYENIKGDVSFKNVSFKYNKGETVLKDFNLDIKHGSSVALVGHTGSGKSTIVNLICRFYEPTEGEILIDGVNYKERSIGWLHSKLGYVLQSPQLFSGTIRDNIKYGKQDATEEEIINAAKTVDAHDFIMAMDKGYDSEVGEGGNRLSLGQKQLISFARAIITDPRILILDEATSSIDTETEAKIQKAIDVVLKGRTSFSIAHRLSTVVNSDLILVLDNGVVIEQGTHKELLNKKGYYFTLYRNQFMQEKEKEIEKEI